MLGNFLYSSQDSGKLISLNYNFFYEINTWRLFFIYAF